MINTPSTPRNLYNYSKTNTYRNTYHSRGDFFRAKHEENDTPEKHWRKLVPWKKLRFQRY